MAGNGRLKRVVFLTLIPFRFLLVPILAVLIIAELFYMLVIWIATGDDIPSERYTPMGWATSGWRWKILNWPLSGGVNARGRW